MREIPLHKRNAFKYFHNASENTSSPEDDYHILSAKERKAIKQIKKRAIFWSAFTGAMAIFVYYFLSVFFADTIKEYTVQLKTLNDSTLTVPYLIVIINFVLVFIELIILNRINLSAVAKIAKICGFPGKEDSLKEKHIEQLFNIGLDAKNKEAVRFGINPYYGIPKLFLLIYTLFFMLKATLSNFLVKMILIKLFPRLGFRTLVDLFGAPIFAFWNAWATFKIIECAKIYIMAPSLIQRMINETDCIRTDVNLKENIYNAMHIVATLKRNYHYNHFVLIDRIINSFGLVDLKGMVPNEKSFFLNLKKMDEKMKKAYSKIILMGVIVDGKVSRKEMKNLRIMYENSVINVNPVETKNWCKKFINGEGLEDFFYK